MLARKDACCSSPAAVRYWLCATICSWAILSLIGASGNRSTRHLQSQFCSPCPQDASPIGFANRTYHCFIDGPLFLIAGGLFLLRVTGLAHFPSWAIWFPLFVGVSISFWLEWRISGQRR